MQLKSAKAGCASANTGQFVGFIYKRLSALML